MPDGRRLRGLTGERIICALNKAGWVEKKSRGKHRGLINPDFPGERVTIPVHKAREVNIKTVRVILKQAHLTPDEFEKLL